MESIELIEIINQKYDGNWIYMIDCEKDDAGTIIRGKVVLSNESRDNVLRRIGEFEDNTSLSSFRYAGKIPEGVHLLL